MSIKLLTMDRQGDFHIRATGNSHCGVAESLDIKYKMICVCAPKLDERGFLFDQINVDNYFKSIGESKLSCEKLTMHCVRELLKRIKEENPSCQIRSMTLSLSPQPFLASMSYEWNAPVRSLKGASTRRAKPFIDI